MEIFGQRVKKELKEQGKQQADLASYLFVQRSTVSEWLNGHNDPPMDAIPKIAIYLSVSTDYLFGLEDESGKKLY